MIYRIDYRNFLVHAIDHFTREELLHFQYAIISAKVRYNRKATNAAKINMLYPTVAMIEEYVSTQSRAVLEKELMAYYEELAKEDPTVIYNTFINTLINHKDLMIICGDSEDENLYIDIFVKFLREKYHIEVIDLNTLFRTGHIGPLYLDRDKIWDKAVDIRRAAGEELIRSKESTPDGRADLLSRMSTKDKIRKLKELGIRVTKKDFPDLNKLLIDAWVEDESG